MHVNSIIERKYWRNIKTGHKVSIFGAVPYYDEADKPNWEIITSGFTMLCSDNCTRYGGFERKDVSAHATRINLARIYVLKKHAKAYPQTAAQCKARISEIPVLL